MFILLTPAFRLDRTIKIFFNRIEKNLKKSTKIYFIYFYFTFINFFLTIRLLLLY